MLYVLIVDDEPHISRVLHYSLSHAGFKVDSVSDGEKALEKIKLHTPDVLITDIIMPRMNGIELREKTRDIVPNADFLTIVLTATTEQKYRSQFDKFNNTVVFEKPISPRYLIDHLRSYELKLNPD